MIGCEFLNNCFLTLTLHQQHTITCISIFVGSDIRLKITFIVCCCAINCKLINKNFVSRPRHFEVRFDNFIILYPYARHCEKNT